MNHLHTESSSYCKLKISPFSLLLSYLKNLKLDEFKTEILFVQYQSAIVNANKLLLYYVVWEHLKQGKSFGSEVGLKKGLIETVLWLYISCVHYLL